MIFLPYLVLACVFSSIVILVTDYFSHKEHQKLIQKRFTTPEAQQSKKPFLLKNLFKPLAPINRVFGSQLLRGRIERRLTSAGSPLTVNEYFVFKELLILFIPLLAGTLIGWDKLFANPLWIILLLGVGYIIPTFWLKARVERRKRDILRAIPSIIDLLILAVDAGLDFMVAVRRVVERSRPGPMVDEISQMYQEVQIGCVRRDALKSMAKRLNLPEINSFARTLIQAERMGTPMGDALRALSEEIRVRQFQRGEQAALKAPIKMLFPLLFCILPVVLILVGGPVLLQFFQSGISFR